MVLFTRARAGNPLRGRVLACLAGLLALASSACRAGPSNDQPPTPIVNEYGAGTPISSELDGSCVSGLCAGNGITACSSDADCPGFYGPASWYQSSNTLSLGCDYPPTVNEYVTGVTVTAVDTWDETGDGAVGTIYLQDTVDLNDPQKIPLYAAMSVYEPTYTPPDLRPEPGDVMDVTGQYEEFVGPSTGVFPYCMTYPQLDGSAAFRFTGAVPEPVEIQPTDLSNPTSARSYLSMLVKVDNVSLQSNGEESGGRYNANVSVSGVPWQISDELWDVAHLCPLSQGQTFKSVTGIVTYFYEFHVAPRSGADFDPPCGPAPDGGTGG